MYRCIAVALALCVVSSFAAKLPSYISTCKRDDPQINKCAVKSSRDLFARIAVTGDRRHNIPVLDPLRISAMELKAGGISIVYTDMYMLGMKDAIFTASRIDLEKRRQEFDMLFPQFKINANYKVAGQLLILPISGSGIMNMTLTNNRFTMIQDFDLVKKNGKSHMLIKNTRFINSRPDKMTIHMSNLFNGDKLLGDNMNRFMNENWRELHKELGPYYDEALAQVTEKIYNDIISSVPYDELYPKTS